MATRGLRERPMTRSEFVDDAGREFRAELKSAKEVRRDTVNRDANGHVPVVSVQINATAENSREGRLTAVGRLRGHMNPASQRMNPQVNSLWLDPANARSNAVKHQPGVLSRLAAVSGKNFAVWADAVAIPVNE